MLFPQGFHITWGTYGTRLHGSTRPHVDRDHSDYGAALAPTDPAREAESRARMSQDPVYLTLPQRGEVERAIRALAKRYGWLIQAIAVQRDHVHVVITAMREGEQLREALKACATKALNKMFGRKPRWAEGGSAKYLWERPYFENAVNYVHRQRDFRSNQSRTRGRAAGLPFPKDAFRHE
jgi:REP element-mobilizing transposase RayT